MLQREEKEFGELDLFFQMLSGVAFPVILVCLPPHATVVLSP
jgi:hypothetical protein